MGIETNKLIAAAVLGQVAEAYLDLKPEIQTLFASYVIVSQLDGNFAGKTKAEGASEWTEVKPSCISITDGSSR
ncbi:MAG: hypothetical protein HRU20_19610 [Pseudomonadales bacterium]|nr:hypothetical protein [Pseudomonadales bacterium]